MAKDLVVVITLGSRDLQVLALDDAGLCRLSPESKAVGIFHRALLGNPGHYRLWLPQHGQADVRENEKVKALWKDGKVTFSQPNVRLAPFTELAGAEAAEEGIVWLIPGRLWDHLRTLQEETRKGVYRLVRALLFHTDRGPNAERNESEPVAAAPIIHTLLNDMLGLGQDIVKEIAVLQPGEELSEKDDFGNEHILSAAVTRVDRELNEASQAFPEAEIRLHTVGGIPRASSVVDAAARLHFPRPPQYRSPSEDAAPAVLVGRSRFTATETLEARRRIRELIQTGQHQAAGALAEEFAREKASWALCVRASASYFTGHLRRAEEQAKYLPEDSQTSASLLPLCREGLPQALHVAMRVEAALRADEVLEGAAWTITFSEVVVIDAVAWLLRKDRTRSCIDSKTRMVILGEFAPATELEQAGRAAGACAQAVEDWLNGKRRRGRPPMPGLLDTSEHWQKSALRQIINKKHPQVGQALKNMFQALRRESKNDNSPTNFRNLFIHSNPTAQEIQAGAQLFEDSSRLLWFRPSGQARTFLHPSGHATSILEKLGVLDPRSFYDQLVKAVMADVRQG